jgi:cyclopropane-fatty-acyl-phospholipid synthase
MRGTFDRIVSVEMLEAVGEAYWSTYFEKLRDSLQPGGLAVLQVITIDDARFENYHRRPDFIQKYIFPAVRWRFSWLWAKWTGKAVGLQQLFG